MRIYEAAILLVGGLYLYGRHKQSVASNINQQVVTPTATTIIPAATAPIMRRVRSPIPKPVQQATQTKYPSRIGGIIFETNVEPGTAVVAGEPESCNVAVRSLSRLDMRPSFNQL